MKPTLARAAALALVLAASPAHAVAQEPAADQPPDDAELQLGTTEVLLDLVVTDPSGRPVADLRPEERRPRSRSCPERS